MKQKYYDQARSYLSKTFPGYGNERLMFDLQYHLMRNRLKTLKTQNPHDDDDDDGDCGDVEDEMCGNVHLNVDISACPRPNLDIAFE